MCLPDARFHVFVYGTLRPGGYFYKKVVAGRAVEATPAVVEGALYALEPGYPGLRPGERPVEGTVLSFSDASLMAQLDELEGYDPECPLDGEYVRGMITARRLDGGLLGDVSVYWIRPEKLIEYRGQRIDNWSIDSYTQ